MLLLTSFQFLADSNKKMYHSPLRINRKWCIFAQRWMKPEIGSLFLSKASIHRNKHQNGNLHESKWHVQKRQSYCNDTFRHLEKRQIICNDTLWQVEKWQIICNDTLWQVKKRQIICNDALCHVKKCRARRIVRLCHVRKCCARRIVRFCHATLHHAVFRIKKNNSGKPHAPSRSRACPRPSAEAKPFWRFPMHPSKNNSTHH